MDSRTQYLQTWLWRDYDMPNWRQHQILVTDDRAQIISNTIAVALTLALPRFLVFIKLLLPPCTKAFSWCHQVASTRLAQLTSFSRRLYMGEGGNIALSTLASDVGNEGGSQDNVERNCRPPGPVYFPHRLHQPAYNHHSSSRIVSGLTSTLQESSSFEDGAARIFRRHLAQVPLQIGETDIGFWRRCIIILKNFKEDKWGFILVSALTLALFAVFIGEQVLAIATASIVNGSTGLSASPDCGLWMIDMSGMSDFEQQFYQLNWFSDSESRAVTYGERCYQDNSTIDACNTFYESKIAYEDKHDSPCPFYGDVCLYGDNSAYTLDTGYLDSRILGINGAPRYQFRRRTACAPLVVNASYIRFGADDQSRVDYLYGNSATDSRTYSDFVGDSWKVGFDLSSYRVIKRRGSALGDSPIQGDMMLLPEFLAPNSEVTVLFIRPMSIVYYGPNDDPIFPADVNGTTPGAPIIWGNPLQRSSVLGCADVSEIRDIETGDISIPKALDWNRLYSLDKERKNLLTLLVISLWRSDTFNAVTSRPGSRFDVQSKLVGSLSQNLGHEQWKLEVRKMFETSLARIQGDVLDIVRGVGKDRPYARNFLTEDNMSLCHIVKFQSVGWRNISLLWLITLPTLAFLLWVLTIEVGNPTEERQQVPQPGEPPADSPENSVLLVWLFKNVHIPLAPRVLMISAWIVTKLCLIALRAWNLLSLAHGWIKLEIIAPVLEKLRAIKWCDLIKSVLGIIERIFRVMCDIIMFVLNVITSFFKGIRVGSEFYQSLRDIGRRTFWRGRQREDIQV